MKENCADSLSTIYRLLYKRFGARHWWPGDTKLEIIIGAILTQNTAWANVKKAIANLKKQRLLNVGPVRKSRCGKQGFSDEVKRLSRISEKRLARLIRPAGYYNIKSRRIKNFLRFLNSAYDGSINRMFMTETARLRAELLGISGIGPETADSILLYAGERPVFVVDAYTKRIFSRHGFIRKDADYEEVQNFFLRNLERNTRLFNEFHALIVETGKNLCKSKKSLCNQCPIRRIRYGRRS